MKAAVLFNQKDLRIDEIDTPVIENNEVLIKVKASGICGSDIPRVLGNGAHFYPNVLGHEFSGEIAAIGKDVNNVKVGDRVAAAPLKPCHQCEDCLKGNHSQCKHYSFVGSREFGAWAEYAKVPARNVVKLPENVSYFQGAFLEPVSVALHGLLLMDFKPMRSVAITGMGTIGLLTLQCAKIMGAKDITVFDVDDDRLQTANELGATHTINTKDDKMMDIIKEISSGRGFDLVLETAGVPATELLCLQIAENKANVMFIGTPHVEFTITPKQFELMNRKELTLSGSWMSYSAPFPGKEWTLGAHYLGTGQIKVEPLLDRITSLEEIWSAFMDIESGKVKGKVMLDIG